MMKKRLIRITEQDLHNIIRESVDRILLGEMRYSGDMLFVSYLKGPYNPSSVKPVEPHMSMNKCINGLWACPVGGYRDWKAWCEQEDFHHIGTNKFTFKLKPGARIYEVHDVDSLKKVSTASDYFGLRKHIDFARLVKEGWDGLYMADEMVGFGGTRELGDLDNWDVESICVFNPGVIVPVSEETVAHNFVNQDDWWKEEE